MTKNGDMLPLLESLIEVLDGEKNPRIWHLDSRALQATRSSFRCSAKKAADIFSNNPIKFTAFHAPSFYLCTEQLLKTLYELLVEFKDLTEPSFLAFMDGKLAKVPDEGSR